MSRPALAAAISELAALYEFGELQAATDPAEFLHTVAEELKGHRLVAERSRAAADETVRLPCDAAILIERVIRELCFHWEGGDLPSERDCKEAHAALARCR